jgi:hypothetical protein
MADAPEGYVHTKKDGTQVIKQGGQWIPHTQTAGPQVSGRGMLDLGATIATGAMAEPVAGLVGMLRAANPLLPSGAGAQGVQATRSALTRPLTQAGSETLQRGIQAIPEPVRNFASQAADYYGQSSDYVAEKVGPIAGAAMKTLPTATAELIGLRGGQSLLKASKQTANLGASALRKGFRSAPSVSDLKAAARTLYTELDDAGVVVSKQRYANLVDDISRAAAKKGLDPDVTPKAFAAMNRVQKQLDGSLALGDIDTVRKVAQGAARSIDPADANVGGVIVRQIDDFLDGLKPQDMTAGGLTNAGAKYKTARDLWGRARRSETLLEAFEKARNQASGFENGIRVQLRSILNNPKKRRFFNHTEQTMMRGVVQGSKGQNLAKLIGRLGFSEAGATNLVGGTIGAAGGGAVFGTPGAIAVPVIGTLSRKLAQRMTRHAAEYLDDVVRAGKDGKRIVTAYMKHTPKSQRSPAELAELLIRGDVILPNGDEFVSAAALLAKKARATAEVAGAAGAIGTPALRQSQEELQATQ